MTWPLYEKTLPLEKSDGEPFQMDATALGDAETYGAFESAGGLLWYMPGYIGKRTDPGNGARFASRPE